MKERFIRCVLAIATVTLVGVGLRAQDNRPRKPDALVNDKPIFVDEPVCIKPNNAEEELRFKKEALVFAIDDELVRQFLQENVSPVPAQEIQKAMRDMVEEWKKNPQICWGPLSTSLDITGAILWQHYLKEQIPESVARSYYEVNKMHFDKIEVRASHILVAVPPTASPAEKERALNKTKMLYKKIAAGQIAFTEAAKKYSDCAATKDQGGDIGPFRFKNVVIETIAKAAFSKKVGDLSRPIATEFGFHLLKVTGRTTGEASEFENVVDNVRELIAQDKKFYERIVNTQRKTAKIEVLLP